MIEPQNIPLRKVIKEIEREIKHRLEHYPKLVERGQIKHDQAQYRFMCMLAARHWIKTLADQRKKAAEAGGES